MTLLPRPIEPIEMEAIPPDDPTAPRRIEGRSPWRLALERLRRDRAAMVALGVIVAVVLVALFAPLLATLTGHGVNHQYRDTGLSPQGLPFGPSQKFLLGTDDQGRDILVRIAYGARISLLVGILATLLTVTIGTVLGLAAGYLGGIVDTVVGRVVDVVLSLPYLLFAIALVSISHPGLRIVIIVIAVFSWAAIARIVRGQVLSIREKEYIEASRSLGASSWRIMFVDILPNLVAPLIVYTTLLIPASIVFEATLSFLGLGVVPPTASWGNMLSDAEAYYKVAWWFVIFPGAALLLTTLAFNLLGDSVRDALDPRYARLFKA
jgi:ABC-type dipeptide/oligopeptide/nickel transport system permease subunit